MLLRTRRSTVAERPRDAPCRAASLRQWSVPFQNCVKSLLLCMAVHNNIVCNASCSFSATAELIYKRVPPAFDAPVTGGGVPSEYCDNVWHEKI